MPKLLKTHDIPVDNNTLDRRTPDVPLPHDPLATTSFRNMFGPSTPAERYAGTGDVPGSLDLLQALADAMARAPEAPGFAVPAGYTYLAQLLSHDVTDIEGGDFAHVDDAAVPADGDQTQLRRAPLLLETIYGKGPENDRLGLYGEGTDSLARWRLRVGRIGRRPGTDLPGDLPRSCPMHAPGAIPLCAADSRNDDNLVIAQLTALFLRLHNRAFDALAGIDKPKRRFEAARTVTRFVYRTLVVKDLMRRLLHPAVYAHYQGGGALLDTAPEGGARRFPVEFSHAVYRFGHSMVRHDYVVNDLIPTQHVGEMLGETASQRPYEFPLDVQWRINWRHFFGPQAQFAQPITPSLVGTLVEDAGVQIPPGYGNWTSDLVLRDLARGLDIGVLTVDALSQRILPLKPEGADDWLAFDAKARRKAAVNWLDDFLPKADAKEIGRNPPLYFFTLLEAEAKAAVGGGDGNRLGFLGSVVVAEVIFGAWRASAARVEDDPALSTWTHTVFGEGAVPETMDQLIVFWPEFVTRGGIAHGR
ncbi:peroxidase family protein [Methylobrevis pamukkalensis]|uniref:Heme peroxidase n=1 Tax=Methylobrevis pamukkalensis TaxID=1439726 RepID=A0A1E3H2C5_9HYPH|nr:peroxidase family protein [Methylobrevis pamukkalensis]ODN70450.1 hypothetical protein A6302_02253 [Methylobrevis pamukkalensis]